MIDLKAGRFTGATGHLIDLIFSGVFDRFPNLQMAFAEVDCGWLPYFKEQLDDGYYRYRFRFDLKQAAERVHRAAHALHVGHRHLRHRQPAPDRRRQDAVVERLPARQLELPNAWSPTIASMAGVPLPEKQLMLVEQREAPLRLLIVATVRCDGEAIRQPSK